MVLNARVMGYRDWFECTYIPTHLIICILVDGQNHRLCEWIKRIQTILTQLQELLIIENYPVRKIFAALWWYSISVPSADQGAFIGCIGCWSCGHLEHPTHLWAMHIAPLTHGNVVILGQQKRGKLSRQLVMWFEDQMGKFIIEDHQINHQHFQS